MATYRVGDWQFFDTNGSALGTVTYAAQQTVDVEEQGNQGRFTWTWDKNPPPE